MSNIYRKLLEMCDYCPKKCHCKQRVFVSNGLGIAKIAVCEVSLYAKCHCNWCHCKRADLYHNGPARRARALGRYKVHVLTKEYLINGVGREGF